MPDLRDLSDEFARLEQQIPEHYRSQIVADRMTQILTQTHHPAPHKRGGTIAMTLLAAAAVIAIAVGVVSLSDRSHNSGGVGFQPTVSHSVHDTPTTENSSASTAPSTHHSSPNVGSAMPASRAALLTYVSGGKTVRLSDYQQSEPGPGQAMRPTPGIAEFNTPSGNITCALLDGGGNGSGSAGVSCQAQQFSFHIPSKPASCQMNWASYFGFTAGGQASAGACVGGQEFGPTTQVLPYGSSLEQDGIRCRSASGFLACADTSTGHGFAVNRDTFKTY